MIIRIKHDIKNCSICKDTKPIDMVPRSTIGEEVIAERPFQKLLRFAFKYNRKINLHFCVIFTIFCILCAYVLPKTKRKRDEHNARQYNKASKNSKTNSRSRNIFSISKFCFK